MPGLTLRMPVKTTCDNEHSLFRQQCNSEHKSVLEGKMEGKRTRGKPRRKMLDLLMEQEDKKISYEELKRRAENQTKWRHHQLWQSTQEEVNINVKMLN